MDLSTLIPKFGNIMVPPGVPFSPQVPGFRDEEIDLNLPAVTLVGTDTVSLSNALEIDADTDYFVRELRFTILPTTTAAIQPSDVRVRIRDGDGHMFTNDFCYANDLTGPLCPPWPIRAGAVLLIDYQNECANADTSIVVSLVLKGYKRRQCSNVAQPTDSGYKPMRYQYPPPIDGEEYRDFTYPQRYDNIDAGGAAQLIKFPIQMDNDADFILRGVCGTWFTNKATYANTANISLTLYDANNLPWNALDVPEPWGGVFGEVRELVLTNGGRIAPMFPEMRIPRGSVILVDVTFGDIVQIFRFGLRGVKAYNKGECK